MQLAGHIGEEVSFEALGERWTASRYERKLAKEFLRWAQGKLPDPVATILERLDQVTLKDAETIRELIKRDEEEKLLAVAEKRQPILIAERYKPNGQYLVEKAIEATMTLSNPTGLAMLSFMNTPEAQEYLLFVLLKMHHPAITLQLASEIMDAIGGPAFQELVLRTSGQYEGSGKNGSVPAAR